MSNSIAKRWCFTINNPIDTDSFWENPDALDVCEYIVLQEEKGENGTLHYQGFLILKKREKITWLKAHFSERAHWEVARGTNQQARDYCLKDDTFTGGLRFEYGKLPERTPVKKAQERLEDAVEMLEIIQHEGYKRPAEIPAATLMQHGFIQAMKECTADCLGPYRPDLKIVTMVGPPGTGKSYAIQQFFPEHGRCIVGNSGVWFQNPCAKVMIFEEFSGEIPLTRMLQLLDVYPLALEVKGGMRPAMYDTVIITSNVTPDRWYRAEAEDEKRRTQVRALYDRLGYSDGSYVPVRKCGHYIQAADMSTWLGQPVDKYISYARRMFWDALAHVFDFEPIEHESLDDLIEDEIDSLVTDTEPQN